MSAKNENIDNSEKQISLKKNSGESEELMKKMLHDEMKNKLSEEIKNNSTQFMHTLKNLLTDDKKK